MPHNDEPLKKLIKTFQKKQKKKNRQKELWRRQRKVIRKNLESVPLIVSMTRSEDAQKH